MVKAVILAGGLGTRISEETAYRPKPMIAIGGKPLLWHIMKNYARHGIHDFVICCGYVGYVIKEYFANYCLHTSNVTFDMGTGGMQIHERHAEAWRVTLVDTGEHTQTGGRLKRVAPYLQGEELFCFTYGDGLGNVDISAQLAFHRAHGRWATVTSVIPPGRFGALQTRGDSVTAFVEKPQGDGACINGGFFVLSPRVLELIDGDDSAWEHLPMQRLIERQQLMAWQHGGPHAFWQPMDTLRDKNTLEQWWNSGKAPWKTWE